MLSVIRVLLLAIYLLLASLLGLVIGIARPFDVDNNRLYARLYGLAAKRLLGLGLQADLVHLHDQAPGCIIVANHQSNFDVFIAAIVLPPKTVGIGKQSLKWLPLFGQLFWLGGNLLIDRGNPYKARRSLDTAIHALRDQHTSIWVFPEGTRGQGTTLMPFKKGAFKMAVEAGVPIVPVCISRYADTLRLGRWESARVVVKALPAIQTAGLTRQDIAALAMDCQGRMQACLDVLNRE